MSNTGCASDLQRRGCNRTSFEFARLLWSLDPYTDPHGALFFLDFLSIRSGMHEWLLSIWDVHEAEAASDGREKGRRFNVTELPGWTYARALALRAEEDAKKEVRPSYFPYQVLVNPSYRKAGREAPKRCSMRSRTSLALFLSSPIRLTCFCRPISEDTPISASTLMPGTFLHLDAYCGSQYFVAVH